MPDSQAEIKARLRIVYHPAQAAIFDDPARVKVIVKGRRFGLTRGYAHYCIERMLGGASSVLWLDTVNSNIDRYVERYFHPVLRDLPSQYWTWRQQKKELELFGSVLDFRSADQPERIEGFGYRLVILNEAGIILNNSYLWENAIRPMTLDYKPDILIGGTPKGKNVFWQLANKAQDRQDPKYADWKYFHKTSYDNPFLAKADIDELAADMPELVKRQEIFAEFLDEAAGVFRNVSACIDKNGKPEPPVPGRVYCAGLDLAKHVDFTVLTVFDDTGRQVYWTRINQLDWPYQKRLIIQVIQSYKARVVMDSTGVGDPIFDDLREAGLDVEGYKFTNDSKKKLVESLMLAFEKANLTLLPEKIQENELNMFEFSRTPSGLISYNAPEGMHDDCVFALALANWARTAIEPARFKITVF
jgi:phage FluMu gp28-like protein